MAPQVEVQPPAVPVARFRGRRVTFVYPVQVQVQDRLAPTMRAHATNLSLGGMFIYSMEQLAPGTKVRIALEVKDRPLFLAEAEVRWVRGNALKYYPWCPGFGVRFLNLSPRSVALVHHLVTVAGQRRPRSAPAESPLPSISDLNAPLDEKDFATKLMFPTSPPPLPPSPPVQRVVSRPVAPRPFASVARKPAWNGWSWVRWGLAVAAVAAWVAAFANVRAVVAERARLAQVQAQSPSPVSDVQR